MHKTKYLVELILFAHPHSIEWKLVIKSSYNATYRQIILEVIPQICTNDADEFFICFQICTRIGIQRIKLELGLSLTYGDKMRYGFRTHQQYRKIDQILHKVKKMNRYCCINENEIRLRYYRRDFSCFANFRKVWCENVAVHARLSKQLYKGGVHLDAFQACVDQSKVKLYYNGDITTVTKFSKMQERFPAIDHWWLDVVWLLIRLPSMIKMIH
jgi:hypothetical protein